MAGRWLLLPCSPIAAKEVRWLLRYIASPVFLLFVLALCRQSRSSHIISHSGWNDEAWLNQASCGSQSSHWHMPSDYMNALAANGEYRVNCFESNNNYERLWKGVRAYKWGQLTSASSSTSLDGATSYATAWAAHHFGLVSGNNEAITVITSHVSNEWACAGNQGAGGEGTHALPLFCSWVCRQLVPTGRIAHGRACLTFCRAQATLAEAGRATCAFVRPPRCSAPASLVLADMPRRAPLSVSPWPAPWQPLHPTTASFILCFIPTLPSFAASLVSYFHIFL